MPAISADTVSTKFAGRAYWFALAVLILLNLGKAVSFVGAGQAFPEQDGINYWKMGIEFSHGDWLLRERGWAHRTPILPAFLGTIQTVFGDYALVAVSIIQQLFVFVIALITAWICGHVTRSRVAILVSLGLSFCCISRSCFADFVMADNLLCMTIVLYLVALYGWLERPTCRKAAAVGALLALTILVKPVAQALLVTTPLVMAYRLWGSRELAPWWRQAGVMFAVLMVVLAPWIIRNKIIFGEYFLSRFTGRTLWITCRVAPEQLPVEFSDGPKTQELAGLLEGTDVTIESAPWLVSRALAARGYPDNEVDKIMEGVMLEGILAHPGQYLVGRPMRFVWFWINVKAWCDNKWGLFFSHRGLPTGWSPSEHPSALYVPPGQVTWSVPFLTAANTALLRLAWHPNMFLNAIVAIAVAGGCLFLLLHPAYRPIGLAIVSILLAISVATSCFTWPEYRFRMPLEPIMIVAVTPMLLAISGRVGSRIFSGDVKQ